MGLPWHEAAIGGDCKCIRRSLEQGEDINRLDKYSQSALMLAAVHGHDDVVELLINFGADLDITAKFGLRRADAGDHKPSRERQSFAG